MAGDWIKMRGNLWDDPRVARLCDLTDAPEAMVIGGLYWLWATADQHSDDGVMHGLTLRSIDRKTGIKGFGDALVQVGWLEDHPEGARITRFEEHNGSSAKRRSLDAQRKATVRSVSASDADKPATADGQIAPFCGAREREEKEKEEEPPKPPAKRGASAAAPPGFDAFWAVYPKRRSRGDAERAWAKLKPDDQLQAKILQAVEVAKARDDWRKDGGQFVPYPASWLNAKGWEDDTTGEAPYRPTSACESWRNNPFFAGVD